MAEAVPSQAGMHRTPSFVINPIQNQESNTGSNAKLQHQQNSTKEAVSQAQPGPIYTAVNCSFVLWAPESKLTCKILIFEVYTAADAEQ